VTRRELLAIVDSLKFFRHYLLGREFLIRTDHVSLKWLLSFKDLESQLAGKMAEGWKNYVSNLRLFIEKGKRMETLMDFRDAVVSLRDASIVPR